MRWCASLITMSGAPGKAGVAQGEVRWRPCRPQVLSLSQSNDLEGQLAPHVRHELGHH